MSAPAMNALSPAPVRITPRTNGSSRAFSNAVRRSRQVAEFSALSTFGRLSVTYAIGPFFSYSTLSSFGESMRLSPVALDEGAEARDGLADDQVLHLVRALVGVEGLGIREEAGRV